jgi:hypothetical protein
MTWVALTLRGAEGTREHRVAHDDTADAGPTLTAGWRLEGDRLEAYGDRLGLIPLFWYCDAQRIVVADTLAELVQRLPQPRFDDAAVAAFLQLGFYLGEDTPFEGVKTMAPGGRIRWQHGCTQVEAPALPIRQRYGGTWDSALPRYVELFEYAVARRARLGVGRLPVSGGRDSRHLFLELLRQGTPPPAVLTQDRPVNNDFAIAQRLASRAGIPHIAIAPLRDGIAEELQKNRWNHYLSDENAWYVQIAPYLAGPLFDGLAGDALSGTDMFEADRLGTAMRKDSAAAAAQAMLDVVGSGLRFLGDALRARWSRDLATQRLALELERHMHAPNPTTSFLFWNRTRREIALIPLTIAAREVPIRLAYLDVALMDFLSSLPYPTFSGTGFHSYVIERTYPRFADVPYSEKRKAQPSLRGALKECGNALHFGICPAVSRRTLWRTSAKALLTGQPGRVAGWLYRILPLLQAARELGVRLPAEVPLHSHAPSPQNG